MLAEWSVEASADDPVLVIPWSDPSDPTGDRRFIDLRENPYDLDHIPEAELYPPLMHALRSLNALRSPVFTAKCDAWPLRPKQDADELETLRLNLDIFEDAANDASHGFVSYIDILWRERSIFTSFHQHEQLLHRLTRHAAPLSHPYAMLDCVLRPALVDLTGPQEGFALSLYIKSLGHDPQSAEENWASALDAVVGLVRSKDLSFA
ncbi:hypothetical protein [Edaphobacter dinghuensis]|uniref:Uncharacterized protein n=1 Tax=Edaphobacter dinghuensis TaxID=1560005 RepID=A0A917HT94_9BACT|nr:hypothetical protein [Edaphobacter dinghuensis]GGG89288.1 hypothetical protein GCM10011585_36860 [Edaphobacter dinghuensis]